MFQDAAQYEKWIEGMNEEIRMIEKKNTWQLVDKPQDKKVIGLKWVYRIKYNQDGSIQKYKARLVAKGYSQQPGIDCDETFALVVCAYGDNKNSTCNSSTIEVTSLST